jgi:hypothetical protein
MHRVDPVGHLARAAQVLPLHAGRGGARLLLAGLVQRPGHQAAPPSGTPRGLLQAGHGELADRSRIHAARLSSRWVFSGARSPACSAIVQPLRLVRPLARAHRYFPACSHGSVRAKHGRSKPRSSPRFRAASCAPILAAAAAPDFVVLTNCMIAGRLPHEQPAARSISQSPSSRTEWLLSY